MALHIIKLCVGCDTVEELLAWRREAAVHESDWRVRTRQTPRRAEEVLDGGSFYRVFKGVVLCRQRVLGIETVGQGAASRCEIILDPAIQRVAPVPRRAFQGWRYLKDADAPQDLSDSDGAAALPTELAVRLRELGAW